MNTFEAMAARLAGEEDQTPLTETQIQARIMDLRETFKRYSTLCPFKPGDLITPSANADIKGAGEPHIVVEIFDPPLRNTRPPSEPKSVGSNAFASRLDMRVLAFSRHGRISPWAVESWQFVPWTGVTP